MEAQALAVHLIETFEFSIPEDKPKILVSFLDDFSSHQLTISQRVPTGVMMPMIDGHMEKGVQMPLHIKLVSESD